MSLAALANQVQSAGRGPDKNLVHMSPREMDYLRQNWGEPTTNPTTGLPEYGWFDSILQYAPALVSAVGGGGSGGFATGLGDMLGAEGAWSPVLGSALIGGAGSALMGGGIKGALTGALLGGAGAALSPLIGNALGGSDIGNWLGMGDVSRETVFGSGAGRTGVGSVSGAQTDMLGQLFSGDSGARLDSYAADPSFRSGAAGLAGAATAASGGGSGGGGLLGGGSGGSGSNSWLKSILPMVALAGIAGGNKGGATAGPPPQQPQTKLPDLQLSMRPKDTSGIDWYTYGQRPRGATFFDPKWTDAEGRTLAKGGQVQGYADGGRVRRMAPGGADLPIEGMEMPDLSELLGRLSPDDPRGQAVLMQWLSQFGTGSGRAIDYDAAISPGSMVPWEAPGDMDMPEDFARGGMAGGALGALGRSPRMVRGPGGGRQDMVEARLSPNEYVVDAETTALIGDGSPDEGARRLDRMREGVRRDKGRALVKGRISPNAKPPESYMRGGSA